MLSNAMAGVDLIVGPMAVDAFAMHSVGAPG